MVSIGSQKTYHPPGTSWTFSGEVGVAVRGFVPYGRRIPELSITQIKGPCMPSGSELSIISGEPAASATHLGDSVMLSITLHAAAVAVAAGSGWWVNNRVHVPPGHASNPSASAIQLTASVSQTTQVVSLQIMQEAKTEDLHSEVQTGIEDATDVPVDPSQWDQADPPLQEWVAEELRQAVRRDLSKPTMPKSESRQEKSTSDAAQPKTNTVDSLKPADAESEAATRPVSAESQAAIASQTIGAQVDVVARPLPTNQPPRFPAAALREGRGGRVVLKVTVNEQGVVTHMSVIRTSGHSDLDRAAMDGVGHWEFEPARRLGLPVTQDIAVPVSFEFE